MMAVKIKPDKYGNAIGLLIRRGGGFETRFERTLIVNRDQKKLLEEAGFIEEVNGNEKPRNDSGKKKRK